MLSPLLAELFEAHRAQLVSVAAQLTGDHVEVEDVLAECRLRLAGVHQSEIEDLREWLTVEVTRICREWSERRAS